MPRTIIRSFILTVLLISTAYSMVSAKSPLNIYEPWVLEAPPGMKVMAGYMIIENESEKERVLNSISSPQFERVEMHETVMNNDQASMIKKESMTVKAGEKLYFKPRGHHLMLINPRRPLKKGDNVEIRLTLKSGEYIVLKAPVRRFDEMNKDMGEHHH